jgi:hypothetical protein
MIANLEEARQLAVIKMQPVPAVYAIVAMARILGMMGREEAPENDSIFKDDNEAAGRVALLLKLGGVEIKDTSDMRQESLDVLQS